MIEVVRSLSRRSLLLSAAALAASPRRFHISVAKEALAIDPSLLETAHAAGVGTAWFASYFYGYWYSDPRELASMRERAEKLGMAAHVINVPLGHPGDSLGSKEGDVPLTPPERWKSTVDANGKWTRGCSLHPPATEENCEALRKLEASGVRQVFLDDDFRLARAPGQIGGCFCEQHLGRFGGDRQALLADVRERRDTPLVRAWTRFICDELTGSFRAMQSAAPRIQLGIMVMYLGSEAAGIRLPDYAGVPLRVGELMFNDRSFNRIEGKTSELYSALFHRRFVAPELAYSETTAFPANGLSPANMAAKLCITTLADVRNTMFMSGIQPIPHGHWETLAPAMRRQAELHRRVAGHAPHGPLGHFRGESSRHTGQDRPYSLFLATGIPYSVQERSSDLCFLADEDAAVGERGISRGRVPESLPSLYAWKREMLPKMRNVPVIEDEEPVVCSWYPTAKLALVWNLSAERREFSLAFRSQRRRIPAAPLELCAVELG